MIYNNSSDKIDIFLWQFMTEIYSIALSPAPSYLRITGQVVKDSDITLFVLSSGHFLLIAYLPIVHFLPPADQSEILTILPIPLTIPLAMPIP